MTAFAEKWGPALAGAGHTQIPDGLLDGKITRALHLTTTEIKTLIGIIRAQGKCSYVESAKQLAFDSRVSYNQTRNNLKCLTAHKKDGGKALLVLVVLPHGRTRYNWMPLRKELEKLERLNKQGGLEVVKPEPKISPAPKPAPIVTLVPPDPDAAYQKAYTEPDEDAIADWEEVKARLQTELPARDYDRLGLAYTHGERWQDETLIIMASSASQIDALQRWRMLIRSICRQMFGNVSLAFKTLAAAALPF